MQKSKLQITQILLFALIPLLCSSQDIQFKEFNYTELFALIEAETDSIFELEDAVILYDPIMDTIFSGSYVDSIDIKLGRKDTLYIDVEIHFKNVHFIFNYAFDELYRYQYGNIKNVVFNKKVLLENSIVNRFNHCIFNERVRINNDNLFQYFDFVTLKYSDREFSYFEFSYCEFNNGVTYSNMNQGEQMRLGFEINNSIIQLKNGHENSISSLFQMENQLSFNLSNNRFISPGWIFLFLNVYDLLHIDNNDFGESKLFFNGPRESFSDVIIENNKINNEILLNFPILNQDATLDWEQFNSKLIHQPTFDKFFRNKEKYGLDTIPNIAEGHFRSREKLDYYFNKFRIEHEEAFEQEIKMRGRLHQLYKSQYLTKDANSIYIELKDLETAHLKSNYNKNKNFKNYFTWKVNQFLKIFSSYGTEPAKAVVFSVYVILFFSFIYLFFPNTWDRHGKNRIIDRYSFFLKYMNKKSGIHEVYLEEKQQEIMAYDDFKKLITQSNEKVPKFFTATALPLYKWAISGTQLSAKILKRLDVMKGTWSELPASKRIGKSILLISVFSFAILYDLSIKALNAIMLSINTFTTLGFGEIPIKGLPRYLAIIQGFIGWFMLTIFSVSLISQLLN